MKVKCNECKKDFECRIFGHLSEEELIQTVNKKYKCHECSIEKPKPKILSKFKKVFFVCNTCGKEEEESNEFFLIRRAGRRSRCCKDKNYYLQIFDEYRNNEEEDIEYKKDLYGDHSHNWNIEIEDAENYNDYEDYY